MCDLSKNPKRKQIVCAVVEAMPLVRADNLPGLRMRLSAMNCPYDDENCLLVECKGLGCKSIRITQQAYSEQKKAKLIASLKSYKSKLDGMARQFPLFHPKSIGPRISHK